MKKKADSLVKRLIEYTKNENRGSIAPVGSRSGSAETNEQPEPIRALILRG